MKTNEALVWLAQEAAEGEFQGLVRRIPGRAERLGAGGVAGDLPIMHTRHPASRLDVPLHRCYKEKWRLRAGKHWKSW